MNHSPVIVWKQLNPGFIEGYVEGHVYDRPTFLVVKYVYSSTFFVLYDIVFNMLCKAGHLDDCFRKAHDCL